jgi:hypothetical protein
MPAKAWSGRGRPTKNLKRDADHKPQSARTFAFSLDTEAWRTITWREGTNTQLSSRFARVRVRPAHRDTLRAEPRSVEWLIIEWPEGEEEPSKYWLSTLPETIEFESFVDHAKLRWRIERDYQELKQEIGLSHYEGRRLARLSPSRRALHRRLRLPDLRTGDDSPPQDLASTSDARRLPFPKTDDPEALPIWTARHGAGSRATVRRRLGIALARSLDRCPCCAVHRRNNPTTTL